ncbi:MAG TPA: helix-turn-helix domain-containing protein, partial [Saliniramus sp.]|nr:helix-turn-helix domain-containing protein [Saliniramus sp.]
SLVRAGHEGLPVGRLQELLAIPASTLSHHLQRLVATGLVTQERQATTLICRANYETMNGLIGFLSEECCADVGCGTASPAVSSPAGRLRKRRCPRFTPVSVIKSVECLQGENA